ncbi:SURF1 family protein [uncultured Dechloromonas sp.]|uniref:SURF1 family protein n=1 Tax=uncultured Dechloromonas sp. TaxID=171719 RepID=UPI0025E4D87C|nr:SURF1 family protein [uncultured Dechloromonas sp.]
MPQYARQPSTPARAGRRRVAIFGSLLLAALLPAFVSLGLWQWRKAEAKTALQAELDSRRHDAPVALPSAPADAESLRHRRVIVRGHYDAAKQILLDNRLYREQAGYHVITPLQLEGSAMHVLVNRGWLAAPADHRVQPMAGVPAGTVELTGLAVLPPQRFFNLTAQPTSGWEAVWQNLDLARFRSAVPYPLQPVVIQLDPEAPGGFVRDWPRPDERADRHRSYALQWFGFAVASLGIWVYFLVRKP